MRIETTKNKIILIPESDQDKQLLESLRDREPNFFFDDNYVSISVEPDNKNITHA